MKNWILGVIFGLMISGLGSGIYLYALPLPSSVCGSAASRYCVNEEGFVTSNGYRAYADLTQRDAYSAKAFTALDVTWWFGPGTGNCAGAGFGFATFNDTSSNFQTMCWDEVGTLRIGGTGGGNGVAFGDLPAATNGGLIYCSDCQKATPCAGGGTGALAKRYNGTWDCD